LKLSIKNITYNKKKCYIKKRIIETPSGFKTLNEILPIWIDGHRVGYQCRLIDKKIGDNYFVWDGSNYLPIRLKGNDLYPPNEKYPKGFNPHKYMNALGSKRNMMLMGYDQGVRWNKEKFTDKNDTFCILVEGPLDAAKIAPPAIAILGKSLSPMQADLIKSKFSKIIIVADNDKAGQEAKKCIYERMAPFPVDEVTVTSGKDAGDLSYEDARNLVKSSEFYKE
jgi:5S rRNA maturation endonuclease (ribonuclease M5)